MSIVSGLETIVSTIEADLAGAAPTPAAATVRTKIDAVTLAQGMATLATLATSVSANAASLPSATLMAIEDIVGIVDPAAIPLLGALQAVAPYVGDLVALLAAGTGVPSGDNLPGVPADSRGR